MNHLRYNNLTRDSPGEPARSINVLSEGVSYEV